MQNILNQLLKFGQKKHLLISIVLFAVFLGLVMPWMQARNSRITDGAGSPDLSITYAPDTLFNMAEAYGEEGRIDYAVSRLTFDLAFPIAYTYFNISFMAFALKSDLLGGRRRKILLILPLLAMLFDLLENTAVSLVMMTFPDQLVWLAQGAGFSTLLKWIFVGAAFGISVLSLVLIIIKRKLQV